MEELGLINDEAYAARLAEQLLFVKKVSARDAIYQMTARGLPRETVEQAVETLSPDPAEQLRAALRPYLSEEMEDW